MGFRATGSEARRVPLHTPPDPIAAIVDVAFFVAVTLLTMRRPSYGVCALILIQPFAYYQDVSSTTITLPKVALLAVLLGMLTYRDAFAPVGERAPWRILTAGLLVLLATLLTYPQALYHAPVMREALKALEYVLLFCVAVAAYRMDPDRRTVRAAFLVSAILVSLLALTQELFGAPSVLLMNGHLTPRIAGPLEGPNQLAGYFDVALPVALALALDLPEPLAFAALFLISCTDVLTFSRGGAVGAIVAVVAVSLVLRRHLRPALTAIGAGAAAGLGVAVSWGLVAHSLGVFRLWNFESTYAGGVGTRPELWRAAMELWRRHPIFGIGAGNFELELPLAGVHGVRTHANSLYLQSLVEGGIPLFAATLWLVYTSIATFARERLESPFTAAAFGASLALAIHQIVDFVTFYPKVGGEWWLLLAIGAAELAAVARPRAVCA
jgi:O-antigen ligase